MSTLTVHNASFSRPVRAFKQAIDFHSLPFLNELVHLVLTEDVVLAPVKVVGLVAIKGSAQA